LFKFLLLFLAALPVARATPPELTISTYDTLIAKDGFLALAIPQFESKCGCKVKVTSSGDAGQILTRLQLDAERGIHSTDVLLGLDPFLEAQARPFIEPWNQWKPTAWKELRSELTKYIPANFLPFDYGYLAFIQDTQQMAKLKLKAPESLGELLSSGLKRDLILEDPRTSTPGLIFLLYTESVPGYWRKLSGQWLTLAPGWDQAYALFLQGEAPLVWSYTTSEAYHEEHGGKGRYKAVLFKEGQPLQIEGAAIARGSTHRELAQRFLEFLLTPDVQMTVAHTNWMYPVIGSVKLPPSFAAIPRPHKIATLSFDPAEVKSSLKRWNESVTLNPAP
jgi:thiamine transport system substrate-binding protein